MLGESENMESLSRLIGRQADRVRHRLASRKGLKPSLPRTPSRLRLVPVFLPLGSPGHAPLAFGPSPLFSGSAFGWSSFLTFVSRQVFSCGRLLLSIPLVQLRAAHKPKTAPCSLPRPSAPLRRLTAPPCAPSLAIYETNVFDRPAKAQFQCVERINVWQKAG